MDVKEFENRRWQREDQTFEFRHRAALDLVMETEQNGTVLDLGSGDGFFLSLLREKGMKGKGLDLSENGVAKARERGIDADVYDFATKKLPFDPNSFDGIVMLDILEHLYDPAAVLREAASISRKWVIVGVPNFSSLPARIQSLFGRVPENNRPKKGHVYWFNYAVLRDIGEKAGLSICTLRVNTTFERIPVVGSIFRVLARVWPSLFALSFVIRFEKK